MSRNEVGSITQNRVSPKMEIIHKTQNVNAKKIQC